MIDVHELSRYPSAAWNAYVDAHGRGRFFHLSDWACVYRDLAWVEPHFLYARQDNDICGVLPLAFVRWAPGACALVAAPYCVECSALASDSAVSAALEEAALALARKRGVRFIEIRGPVNAESGWQESRDYATFERSLERDDDSNLKAVPRKQRAMIRKGEANGLEAVKASTLDQFYAHYCESVHMLGTPAYDRQLFEAIRRHFGERVDLHGVADADGPVATVMSFYYKETVMPYFAGAASRARNLKAYDYLYWTLMHDAVTRGCRRFDFGRSQIGSGAYAFKKNWGFEPRPLTYSFRGVASSRVKPLNPDSAFNRFARETWARLPLSVAVRLGPRLSRRLF